MSLRYKLKNRMECGRFCLQLPIKIITVNGLQSPVNLIYYDNYRP